MYVHCMCAYVYLFLLLLWLLLAWFLDYLLYDKGKVMLIAVHQLGLQVAVETGIIKAAGRKPQQTRTNLQRKEIISFMRGRYISSSDSLSANRWAFLDRAAFLAPARSLDEAGCMRTMTGRLSKIARLPW